MYFNTTINKRNICSNDCSNVIKDVGDTGEGHGNTSGANNSIDKIILIEKFFDGVPAEHPNNVIDQNKNYSKPKIDYEIDNTTIFAKDIVDCTLNKVDTVTDCIPLLTLCSENNSSVTNLDCDIIEESESCLNINHGIVSNCNRPEIDDICRY